MEDFWGDDIHIPIIQKQLRTLKADISFLHNHCDISKWKSQSWRNIYHID